MLIGLISFILPGFIFIGTGTIETGEFEMSIVIAINETFKHLL